MPDMDEVAQTDELPASSPDELREQAIRQVKKRRDFHAHAFSYVVINLFLWGLWIVIGVSSHSWYPWPVWVTLAWGLGLAFNAWDVYVRKPMTESEIQDEMRRIADRR